MTTPVWLLDVDGVVNAICVFPPRYVWPDWRCVALDTPLGRLPIQWAPPVVEFIVAVHDRGLAEIRWLTTWEDDAAAIFAPAVGLPQFPVAGRESDTPVGLWPADIRTGLARAPDRRWWKLYWAQVVRHVEGRPLVWTDDELVRSRWSMRWLESQTETLALAPERLEGLGPTHLAEIAAFLDAQ